MISPGYEFSDYVSQLDKEGVGLEFRRHTMKPRLYRFPDDLTLEEATRHFLHLRRTNPFDHPTENLEADEVIQFLVSQRERERDR